MSLLMSIKRPCSAFGKPHTYSNKRKLKTPQNLPRAIAQLYVPDQFGLQCDCMHFKELILLDAIRFLNLMIDIQSAQGF